MTLFGQTLTIDLSHGFPLLSGRELNWKAIRAEFLWFLSGDAKTDELRKHTKIWDPWTNKDGTVDSPYGFFWRKWHGEVVLQGKKRQVRFDQLRKVEHQLKKDPTSRRMVVTAWDPINAEWSKLPPCHFAFVFDVDYGHLNCHVCQRSADLALGVPFDVAEYALLVYLLCKVTGLIPGTLFFSFTNAHIYVNHINGIIEQINRPEIIRPAVTIDDVASIDGLTSIDQIHLTGYAPHPPIKYPIAV